MLRNGHPIAEELQCVITTMAQQGKNVSHNYYHNADTTVRYHSSCQAPDNWVEMTRKSKFIVTMNREIVVATVIATDDKAQTLFNLDSVGDIERDDGDISVEVKNTIVNFIDQQALTSNGMVATLVAALTPPNKRHNLFSCRAAFTSQLSGWRHHLAQPRQFKGRPAQRPLSLFISHDEIGHGGIVTGLDILGRQRVRVPFHPGRELQFILRRAAQQITTGGSSQRQGDWVTSYRRMPAPWRSLPKMPDRH